MPRFIVRRCCANAACRRAAGVRRAISVDWLGQKPAEPAPSTASRTNACHGSRTSGSSPKPTACRTRPAAERQPGPKRSMIGPGGDPGGELRGRDDGDDEPGGAEPEPAHVVQVDDEERAARCRSRTS